MVSLDEAKGLLAQPLPTDHGQQRGQVPYAPLHRFTLDPDRPYQQQFGDMYFLRLTKIKPALEQLAAGAFGDVVVGGETAARAERVLDVRQGELCWMVGTIYMDMPLKPNVLEEVALDQALSRPSTVKKYIPDDDGDLLAEGRGSVSVMLEDESGRIRLVGKALRSTMLVTGCIIAVMGTETQNGEFEVLDLLVPDLPPQPARYAVANTKADGDTDMGDGDAPRRRGRIAIVSGLNFSGPHGATAVDKELLLEYLVGESLGPDQQAESAQITRLIIAGNSAVAQDDPEAISPADAELKAQAERQALEDLANGSTAHNSTKKYGYDPSAFNPVPTQLFDEFLAELLPTMPVTVLPGASDAANASLPQQPIHPAVFPHARVFASPLAPATVSKVSVTEPGWLDTVTNPWEGEVAGWRFLGTSGQTIDDIQKYVASNDRLSILEATARWRVAAPTAPDTLWAYPFQDDDPFVLDACPHVYFAGSQPEFGTRTIDGPAGQAVRLICVPAFSKTRELVLLDTETLDVTRVQIGK